MPKTLILAEKPSVMTDLSRVLAKVLGKFDKKGQGRDRYYENDKAIITSAVGHLVELRMPVGLGGKKLPWKFEALPAIPRRFELDPIPDSVGRLRQVVKLARDKNVDLIVNACDAGREGELIFRYIMDIGDIKKPVKRLWMQSMTPAAILAAWEKLRSNEEMQPLADAARCRSESDWLVGLNATRALTCFRSRHGGFNLTSAGRVQTPTLAILAKREAEIRAFVPEDYFEVHGTFGVKTGEYLGKWVDLDFKKDPKNNQLRAERLWDRESAEAIVARCQNQPGVIEETKKPVTQIAPQLYDLTTLQREAPFSAKGTLAIAQALYEKHKMITYPRTDSRYLPEDYQGTTRATLADLAKSDHPAAEFAHMVLHEQNGAKLTKSKRVFDTSKVSDHFAIIPTGVVGKLSDTEAKVYDMIVRRFIGVFFPHAEFEQTIRLTKIHTPSATDVFKSEGRVLISPGWQAVAYGRKPGVAAGRDELTPVAPGESAETRAVELIADQTKPPARYTESTLLSAMEGAGKLVDDEALAAAMSERGLGTPATRAAIIETLIRQKYIVRDGNGGRSPLHVTRNGMRLIEILREMDITGLTSPEMTGDWEYKLHLMQQGQLDRSDFMAKIESYTEEIVAKAKKHAKDLIDRAFPDLDCPCPVCGAPTLKQTDATYECTQSGCKFRIKKHIAGREITPAEAKQLFTTGFVGPLQGFMSRFNKPFEAGLKLDDDFKVTFVFESDDRDAQPEFTDDNLLGTYTLTDGREMKVYVTDKAWFIPGLVTKKDPEGVRIGRTMLQCEIPEEQLVNLLTKDKTELIKGFISKKNRRPFDAFLKFDPQTGKIGFEFPPRPNKKTATKAKK